MKYYKQACYLKAVVFSEDVGFFEVVSNGKMGGINGLFKSDVDVKGLRFATGLTWYAGNYEVGALVNRDGEYLEIVKMSAKDFFDNDDVENGNVALLCAVSAGNYGVYVAAVAFMGGGDFLFASNIINVAGTWKDSDIGLPKKIDGYIAKDTIDLSDKDYTNLIKVSSKRIVSSQKTARQDMFKIVASNLDDLNIPKPDSDILDVYAKTPDTNIFLTDKGVYVDDNKVSDYTVDVDMSNLFSNYIFNCSTKTETEAELLDNGDSLLCVPTTNDNFAISGFKDDVLKTYIFKNDALLEYEDIDKWTDYFLYNVSRGVGESIVINTQDKNLIKYKDYVLPPIPKDTLSDQTKDIKSIVGISRIIKYTED